MRLGKVVAGAAAILAVGGLTLGALASCAKSETEDMKIFEQRSLDAWMTKNNAAAIRQPNGVWVEFITDGDQSLEAPLDTTMWVKAHYTSTDLEGNVFATRDSMVALKQRSFTPYTYYSPEYLYCGDVNAGMPDGLLYAFKNKLIKPDGSEIKLSLKSRVKLFLPSFLAFGTSSYSNTQGYGGQYSLAAGKIVVQDIEVRGMVKNPLTAEEELVKKFAMEKWRKGETDTLAPGMWLDTTVFNVREDLLKQYPRLDYDKKYSLTVDSTATIRYIGKFLPSAEYPDGFIFDTNIPEVYESFFNRRKNEDYAATEKTHSALSYKPSQDQESYIAAFYRAIPNLRRGQWSRIVFPSSYGYGSTGLSKAVQDEQEYYNTMMSQYYMYSSMYNSYGSSYGGYGSSYYGNYYDPYSSYYGYSTSGYSTEEDEQTIVTEIQAYTPLMFEIYIEPLEE